MIDFIVTREKLLKPLITCFSIVEKNPSFPILNNILISIAGDKLILTSYNLNIQIKVSVQLEEQAHVKKDITLSGMKILEIVKFLPNDSKISFFQENDRVSITCGKSKYQLTTLPASNFPHLDSGSFDVNKNNHLSFSMQSSDLRYIIEKTSFCMAVKDIRRCLNGLLIEIKENKIKVFTTDGHRLAYCYVDFNQASLHKNKKIILPRKSVYELLRILSSLDEEINIAAVNNLIQISTSNGIFTSKLIEGDFPECDSIVSSKGDKTAILNKKYFISILHRVSVLSNTRYCVQLYLSNNHAKIFSSNNNNEEAEDNLDVIYAGADEELGFNIKYILDSLSVIESENIKIIFSNAESSVLIQGDDEKHICIVMPMKF